MANTYPVVSEIWTLFEGTLILQAKRLVEDIAKHQKADPKALWAKIKPQVRIGIIDIDLPEPLLTLCSHPSGSCEGGAIALRCRAPCLLGFDACQKHIGTRNTQRGTHELVDRVLDFKGGVYFVDSRAIAHDRNGRPKGYVKDEVLYLFEKEV